jgi:hypothetical protein
MSSRSSIIWNAMPRFQPKCPSESANPEPDAIAPALHASANSDALFSEMIS